MGIGMTRILLAVVIWCSMLTGAGAQALQAGDTVSISVYQDPKLDRQIRIGPTGLISFPLAGSIHAGGMTPQQLESALRGRLKEKFQTGLDIAVDLVAPAQLLEEEKPRIFVTGEVLRPGPFIYRQRTTVIQAIALAGGFSPFAAKHRIQVRRRINGAEVMVPFDYKAFFSGRDVEGNVDLRANDVVIVPERGLFEFD